MSSGKVAELPIEDHGIFRVTAGVFPSNCYICPTQTRGECFVIDPGLGADAIESALVLKGLTPRWVFCTHGHFDHVGSAAAIQRKYGAPVYLHKSDAKIAKSSNFLMMAFNVPARIELPAFTLIDGDFVHEVDGAPLRYRGVPGHTPGSCLIEYGHALFSGDSIYARGVGLSKVPGENPDLLRKSLLTVWPLLPDTIRVYPGHGTSDLFGQIRADNLPLTEFLGVAR